MASNVAIKITAETADLEAKFSVASARVREFNTELNKLARDANTNGATDALRQQMLAASESLLQAKNQASALSNELKANSEPAMRRFGDATGLAKEALGALGIGLSIGAVVEFGRSVFDSAASLEFQSKELGLSTDALQAFSKSATDTGVPLDVVEASLRRFNVAQGQAQEGSKLQADAFRELGVSAEGPAQDILPRVARALLSLADPAQRSRIEMALFGRAGEELNSALPQWAQGVDKLTQSLKDQNRYLGEDQIKAADDAKQHMGAVFDQMAVAWTPAVVALSEALAKLGQGLSYLASHDFLGNPVGLFGGPASGAGGLPFAGRDSQSFAVPKSVDVTKNAFEGGGSGEKPGVDHTRQIADEQVSIWEQASQKRIEGEQQANQALLALGNESLEQFRDQAKRLEEARYQAALGGLQARTQIDKEDAVALARDNAEMEVIAVDHANKMAEIDNRYEEDHLRAVKEAADKESALRQAAFNADFAARQEQARLEITQIQQSNAEIEAINRREVAAKRAAMQEIGAVESQLVHGIISGRQSAGQIASQIAQTLLEKELTADLAYLTEHEAINLGILASDQATAQEGLLAKLAAWAAEKLGFTVAAAEKTTVAAAEYAAQVPMIIGLAGAGGVASMAAAPFPIDLTAPAFGASMAAAAAGFAVLDTGTDFVPRDMPALIHQGERVLPAADNKALISALNGGGSNALHMNNTFHISAGTPADVAGQLKKHLVGAIQDAIRGGYLKLA